MVSKRTAISKATRFAIFARDNFTCRYCGRQSDVVPLEVDHVIPVCQDGTNDRENLITACKDCNRGKSGKTIPQTVPTEADRLRLAQERNEQVAAAEAAKQAASARHDLRQAVVNYWCDARGFKEADSSTINVIVRYVEEFGAPIVFAWIDHAAAKLRGRSDCHVGRYISGIRRSHKQENGLS